MESQNSTIAPGLASQIEQTQTEPTTSATETFVKEKPHSRGFALAGFWIGWTGLLFWLILFTVFAGLSQTGRNFDRDIQNHLSMLWLIPFAAGIFLLNCLGLLSSGIALCRTNGRWYGICGLFMNVVPAMVCLLLFGLAFSS